MTNVVPGISPGILRWAGPPRAGPLRGGGTTQCLGHRPQTRWLDPRCPALARDSLALTPDALAPNADSLAPTADSLAPPPFGTRANPFAGFETHYLSNGLKVWFKRLPEAPNVSISVGVPYGWDADPRGRGSSHTSPSTSSSPTTEDARRRKSKTRSTPSEANVTDSRRRTTRGTT